MSPNDLNSISWFTDEWLTGSGSEVTKTFFIKIVLRVAHGAFGSGFSFMYLF